MRPTRVMVVDDHLLSRKGIAAILAQDPAFEIVGEAADGTEAVEKAHALMPDLILMDIKMPGVDGLEATKRIKAELPYVTIVILSVSNDPRDFFEAVRNGAQGYLLKDMQPDQWLDYLRAVVHGETPISREMAVAILQEFADQVAEAPANILLSQREQEILRAVAAGLSNREIGEELHIAETTVKNHLRNILAKLHLRNRAQLVAYAYERGWLRPARTAGQRARTGERE